jgi:hypothetical protein
VWLISKLLAANALAHNVLGIWLSHQLEETLPQRLGNQRAGVGVMPAVIRVYVIEDFSTLLWRDAAEEDS